jgi:hypothetical protein
MLFVTTKDQLAALAKERAQMAGIDPVLCCAICEQESSWNLWAVRDEPDFYQRYVVKLHLGITEAMLRACSFGLMQLMGEVAREEGFTGDILSLTDPQLNLDRGLIHFKRMLAISDGDVHTALQHWNGGSNPNYADEVLARLPHYQ